LRDHDYDADVRVTVIRGAGPCFSAGYDLGGGPLMDGAPLYSAPGDGQWARQCNDTWFSIWDLAKPVISQIHGYAIAGATELASACDLVYVADDAQISYPVVRVMSPPDWQYHTVLLGLRRAMELMLTGDAISGVEAAAIGFANRSFPADELDVSVLAVAARVAGVPSDLAQINKRSVHRAFDVWGARAAIRAGTELQALAGHTRTAAQYRDNLLEHIKHETKRPD
jgi:enoyl-CoA hydratase